MPYACVESVFLVLCSLVKFPHVCWRGDFDSLQISCLTSHIFGTFSGACDAYVHIDAVYRTFV